MRILSVGKEPIAIFAIFELTTWHASFPDFFHKVIGSNYCLQMIQTGFVEQFYASHRMGPAPNLFENFSENNLKGDLSNDTTDNPPLFSLVNTFNLHL